MSAGAAARTDGWAVCGLPASPDRHSVSCYRWLKFEEDVEDGGERWSKPYVATLSLHSLFELRSCIFNGTVLLDMRANTIEEIAGGGCNPLSNSYNFRKNKAFDLFFLKQAYCFSGVISTHVVCQISSSDMVLDHQEIQSPLGQELRKKVRGALLKQHHHQNQKKLANRLPIVRSIADMSRRASELHLDKAGEEPKCH